MSKNSEFNSRHLLFLLKVSICFAGLLLGSFILAPKGSMQNDNRVVVSNNMVSNKMIGNYRPTPEPPKSAVRGRVFYADTGRPVKRASLMFIPEDASGGPSQSPSALTDNDGNFQMKDVQAGTYYAIINVPGVYSPLAYFDFSAARGRGSEKEAFKKAFEGFEAIVHDGVSETFVEIPARRGGAIGGRVIYDDGDAAIGVKVEILRKSEDKFMSSIPNLLTLSSMRMGGGVFQTDDRGVYRFAGLPPGEYIVKVSENVSHTDNNNERSYYDPFEGSMGGKSFLSIFYPDVSDTKSAQVINVAPGQEVSEINLTLPSRNLYKVEGRIIARKDKSPVRVRINIKKKNQEETFSIFDEIGGRQQQASTDEAGNWKFKELPKGTYTLTIEPISDERDYLSNPYSMNSNAMNSAPRTTPAKPKLAKKVYEITIEDKDLNGIIVELGYGATVSGTVVTENSREMPASVSIIAGQEDSDITSSDMVSNSPLKDVSAPQKTNNDFKIEDVTEGKTEFSVSVGDENFYVKSATLNGTDLLAGSFELKEGENLRNVQIVLSKNVGTLKGSVLDAAKSPVNKAEFSLVPVDAAKRKNPSYFRHAITGENGEFQVKAPPFEYAIVFFSKNLPQMKGKEFDLWLDEAVKNAVKVTIKANETENVSLTMPEK